MPDRSFVIFAAHLSPAFCCANAISFLASFSIDIDQSDYGAVDLVLGCAIRSHAEQIVATLSVSYSPLMHAERLEHFPQKFFQIGNVNVRFKVGDRPPNIALQDIETGTRRWRHSPDH